MKPTVIQRWPLVVAKMNFSPSVAHPRVPDDVLEMTITQPRLCHDCQICQCECQ